MELKVRIPLEALRGDKALQAIEGLGEVLSNGIECHWPDHESEFRELQAMIRGVDCSARFLSRGLGQRAGPSGGRWWFRLPRR